MALGERHDVGDLAAARLVVVTAGRRPATDGWINGWGGGPAGKDETGGRGIRGAAGPLDGERFSRRWESGTRRGREAR